ncbi:ABC transporter permease [Acuticoccus sp. MNP-M23]|uniref:ABC transporter permease n=1 Tax=Acuticoccus sp. MNP-M23 TaxID=3072793 RepID=UPI0028160603|nr:ABC transporter permease [Acuticoccus sp. MNP-M23]WMS41971.1 ABC transporter permease [Acuticoccus sp. MNP-M23]
MTLKERATRLLLRNATIPIFAVVLVFFGFQSDAFLTPENVANIIKQSSFIGIAAVGMSFVLLTRGIDLSVGSVMYLGPLLAGIAMRELPIGVAGGLLTAVLAGLAMGAINALFIVRLNIAPFIVTLATLFFFRGAGTWITSSRQFDFDRSMLDFGLSSVFGVPLPVIVFVLVALAAWIVLSRTSFGRQIYAVGADPEVARKAGIRADWVRARVYLISSACAATAGFILIAQIGRLDVAFGEGREFDVIAAAVLGGVSLFGGVGTAFGAAIGAVLIQTVRTGLVFTAVNLYLQPIVLAAIIFAAVLIDGQRDLRLRRSRRRAIRPLTG